MTQLDDLKFLVEYLMRERGYDPALLEDAECVTGDARHASDTSGKNSGEGVTSQSETALFTQFRALVNTREPGPASEKFIATQNRVLQGMIARAGITQAATLERTPLDARVSLWRGDITTLAVDAIVNAANSQMLGCWVPGHHCIDNAIHTFAGIQLRHDCAQIMAAQGHEEPTAQAKVTPGYNLPARHVIHTVGPITNGQPTAKQRAQLAQCYTSCLDAARARGLNSIAFCCISTGVFGFPQTDAAQIATSSVRAWLDANNSSMHVIFNVFTQADERLYHDILF